jgi:FlaA1/EpsC-like NDP-sugar epimerase
MTRRWRRADRSGDIGRRSDFTHADEWGLGAWLLPRRTAIQMGYDALAWGLALFAASAIRFDLRFERIEWLRLVIFWLLAIGLQWASGAVFRLYRGRYRFGSFEEVEGVLYSAALTALILIVIDIPFVPRIAPISVPPAAGVFALVLMAGVRYYWRLLLERRARDAAEQAERVIVLGAGRGGAQAILAMQHDNYASYVPVALLDDDPRKRPARLGSLRVAGTRASIPEIAQQTGATVLLIAIPSADAAVIRDVSEVAEAVGLTVKVLPPVGELLDKRVRLGDIRDLDIVDLLGRHQVETDIDAIAEYLTGKRVLVTGAGGSIGSELCRQISRYGPAELIMLDRDESALHSVQLSISGRAMLDSSDTVLADLRDESRMDAVFAEHRPEVVFHAAALKHLPLLEQYPGEAVKTNVWGTLTVLRAARTYGVDRFVNISSDKAANPTSILGYTKRVAERLTAGIANDGSAGTYLSVRFGNVLGSRGSVLSAFQAQIAGGGPVTVTHRDVARYFMTVQEAVQLVIQAAAIGRPGEVLVLDMGEQVRIDDIARRLIAQEPRAVTVVYTGLRPGEKMREELFGTGERDTRPIHPLVSHVDAPPLDPQTALSLDAWASTEHIRASLDELCTYQLIDLDAAERRKSLRS